METTIKNDYGEKIHIKLEHEKILIHHEDATDEFKPLQWVLKNIILSKEEIADIQDSIKELSVEHYLLFSKILESLNREN